MFLLSYYCKQGHTCFAQFDCFFCAVACAIVPAQLMPRLLTSGVTTCCPVLLHGSWPLHGRMSGSRKRTNSGCTTTTFCALDDMEGSKGETVMVWDAVGSVRVSLCCCSGGMCVLERHCSFLSLIHKSILQALGGSDACWLRLVAFLQKH